jgi:acyl-coenzyme A thioesterase PaaI-like protein
MRAGIARAFGRARQSKGRLWRLNLLMWIGIPFNAPHRLSIAKLTLEQVQVRIPFRRSNKNHLGSLHACAMATAAEYSSGLVLLQHVSADEYRLIMTKIEVVYHAQGRTAATAHSELASETVKRHILDPLQGGEDAVMFASMAEVHDLQNRHLCTATVHWQIKRWDKVRARAQQPS